MINDNWKLEDSTKLYLWFSISLYLYLKVTKYSAYLKKKKTFTFISNNWLYSIIFSLTSDSLLSGWNVRSTPTIRPCDTMVIP